MNKDTKQLCEIYKQFRGNKIGRRGSIVPKQKMQNPIEILKRARGEGHANFEAIVHFPTDMGVVNQITLEKYLTSLYNEIPEVFERSTQGSPGYFLRNERDFRIDVNGFNQVDKNSYDVDFDITFTK